MVFGRSGPSLRERFGISWRIVRQSLDLLGRERDLWILPILSGLTMIAAIWIVHVGTDLFGSVAGGGLLDQLVTYALIAAYLLPATFVTIFLNASLVDAVHHRLSGEDRSLRDAIGSAADQIVPILVFSLLSAAVGAVLSFVGQAVDKLRIIPGLGRIVQAVGSLAWAVATYFVLPLLIVDRERSAIEAIRSSKSIAEDHWGESVGGIVTVGLAVMVPVVVLMFVGIIGLAFLGASGSLADGLFGPLTFAFMFGAIAVSAVLGSALNTTYQTALFRYTRTGEAASPFTEGTLDEAWEPYREG